MLHIREDNDGVLFWITVKPRSKRNEVIAAAQEQAITVRVTAPPVEGKANEACRTLLAKVLGISKTSVTIRTGEASARKLIHCKHISPQEVQDRLQEALKREA